MPKQTAPYGTWKSPITSELIVSEAISITGMALDGDDVYWVEMRSSDGARNVVVRRTPDGKTQDVTGAPYNVRTRVHEYGGGALAVADGVMYFSNFDDQRLYRQPVGGDARPLTPEADMRYADGNIDRRRGVMVCVREDHTSTWQEPVNTLVAIDLQRGGGSRVLVSGNNFYASPRVSPDSTKLAWLAWNHPNMPWDGTELWVGELRADGSVGERQRVAVARAVVREPALLLADEPTGNLDPKTGDQILELLLELNNTHQSGLVVVTHSPEIATRLGRKLVLSDGCVVGAESFTDAPLPA